MGNCHGSGRGRALTVWDLACMTHELDTDINNLTALESVGGFVVII